VLRRTKVERNAFSGAIYSFGSNTHGLLGHQHLEAEKNLKDPRLILYFKHNDQRIINISSSVVHAAAVTSSGWVFTWGACVPCAFGYLEKKPSDATYIRACPTRVEDLDDVQIISVALGNRHSVGLSDEGCLYTWGSGEFGQLGHGEINGDGNEIFKRQFDYHTGHEYPYVDLPFQLDRSLFDDAKVIQVACGYYFCAALCEDGCVYTWGEGSDGQLGIGYSDDFCVGFLDNYVVNSNFTYIHTPKWVNIDEPIGHISIGGNHVYAVARNYRNVYEWGAWNRRCGEGKDAVFSPQLSHELSQLYVKQISSSRDHSLAICGTVYLKIPDCELMYGLASKFGSQPVELYSGVDGQLVASSVVRDTIAYANKENFSGKVVYIDRGKSTGVWLSVEGYEDVITVSCCPSSFGPKPQEKPFIGKSFYTPQKLSSLSHYVRPEEIEGKIVVIHFDDSDIPVHHEDDDVSVVIERLMLALVEKVRDAQNSGASGLVIIFSFIQSDVFSLEISPDEDFDFTIPSVMLNQASGAMLLNHLSENRSTTLKLYSHADTLGNQVLNLFKYLLLTV